MQNVKDYEISSEVSGSEMLTQESISISSVFRPYLLKTAGPMWQTDGVEVLLRLDAGLSAVDVQRVRVDDPRL